MQQQDEVMLNLSEFRANLARLMQPEVLKELAAFLEATADGDPPMLNKYQWFVENSQDGLDCKYARMAKEFFLENQAPEVAKAINWLYLNWARHYED